MKRTTINKIPFDCPYIWLLTHAVDYDGLHLHVYLLLGGLYLHFSNGVTVFKYVKVFIVLCTA